MKSKIIIIIMDFAELVKHRQSDRKYSARAVEKEKLLQCLEAARLAPSAITPSHGSSLYLSSMGS